jgi:hypothetical protein
MDKRFFKVYINSLCLVVLLLFTTITSVINAGASQGSWETDLLLPDTSERNLSTVFTGHSQIPIFSTTDTSSDIPKLKTYWQYPGSGGVGQDQNWIYLAMEMPTIDVDHVSDVAEHTYSNTFVLSWVYVDNNEGVYRIYMECEEDETEGISIVSIDENLIYIPPSGYSVRGKPSHALDSSGNPHVAIVVGQDVSPYNRMLIYIKKAQTSQSSCNVVSYFDCTTVESRSLSLGGLGFSPKITVNANIVPGILFYDGSTHNLTFAYPQIDQTYYPNCGPGDNTWRCVSISSVAQSGSLLDSDTGINNSQPQFAWTYAAPYPTSMYHAYFVGSGGNCGDDYYRNSIGNIVHGNRWQCIQVTQIGYDPIFKSTSIQVDDEYNAIIAFNSGEIFRLGVVFWNSDANTYSVQTVDSGPFNTGMDASLALSKSGRGFIAYIEDEEYSPNLKIALQYQKIFLPMIIR